MPMVMIAQLVIAAMGIFKAGILGWAQIKSILDKYKDVPATAETIEALRLELLTAAKINDAVDDPKIRAILIMDGIDPESLRIS